MDTKQDIYIIQHYIIQHAAFITSDPNKAGCEIKGDRSSDNRIYCPCAKTPPKAPRVSGSFQISIGRREVDAWAQIRSCVQRLVCDVCSGPFDGCGLSTRRSSYLTTSDTAKPFGLQDLPRHPGLRAHGRGGGGGGGGR